MFKCKCGCGKGVEQMNVDFILKLRKAQDDSGLTFKYNSGFRCAAHNKKVGGSKTSSHIIGEAVDIAAKTSRDKFNIAQALLLAGFTRLGIGKTFIHADTDKNKAQGVIWVY